MHIPQMTDIDLHDAVDETIELVEKLTSEGRPLVAKLVSDAVRLALAEQHTRFLAGVRGPLPVQ